MQLTAGSVSVTQDLLLSDTIKLCFNAFPVACAQRTESNTDWTTQPSASCLTSVLQIKENMIQNSNPILKYLRIYLVKFSIDISTYLKEIFSVYSM